MHISFKNTKTGEILQVKVGFSWILFLFSFAFGIPLFLRRLYVWGAIFFVLEALLLILPFHEVEFTPLDFVWIAMLGLSIYMGVKGNEITAKNYLENGWEFSDELNDEATLKFAKTQWRLA